MWRSWSHGDAHSAVSTKSLLHCTDMICSHCHKGQCLAKHLLAFCMLLVQMEGVKYPHFSVSCTSLLRSNSIHHSLFPCHHTPLHNLHTHFMRSHSGFTTYYVNQKQAKNLRGYAMLIIEFLWEKCLEMKLCVALTSSHSF